MTYRITWILMCILAIVFSAIIIHEQYLEKQRIAPLRKIAENGDCEAYWCLYSAYKEDDIRAEYWLEKGALCGEPRSQEKWADRLLSTGRSEAEKKIGLELLIKSANNGNANARHHLGYLYKKGIYVGQDLKKSEYWYRSAASKGDSYRIEEFSKFMMENHDDLQGLTEAYMWSIISFYKNNNSPSYQSTIKKQQAAIIQKAMKMRYNIKAMKKNAVNLAKAEQSQIEKNYSAGANDDGLAVIDCKQKMKTAR